MTTETGPKTIVLETSSRVGMVALARGRTVLGQRVLDERRRHARDLAPSLQQLLQEQGWKPKEVDAVIVNIGPGSYTGLRVGIMSAKAWAYATGCRLLGVPSFEAVAWQVAHALADQAAAGVAWVLEDAQQGRVYCQRFALHRQAPGPLPGIEALTPLQVLPLDAWLAQVEEGAVVAGPALRLYQARLPGRVLLAPEPAWLPQPAALAHLGLARLERGEADNVLALEPLYARPSAAEEQWQKRAASASGPSPAC